MGPRFFGALTGALLNEARTFCCLTGEKVSLLQARVVFSSHKNSKDDEELEEQADDVDETLDLARAPDICGDVDLDSCWSLKGVLSKMFLIVLSKKACCGLARIENKVHILKIL